VGKLQTVPISREQAHAFTAEHHRHHKPPLGEVFRLACERDGLLVGVATIGRPVARRLQDGLTLEVTRVCVIDEGNQGLNAASTCSFLYASAWRVARELGYHRIITYTLASESGTSVRAAGWRIIHETPGRSWSVPSRPRTDKHPLGPKLRWEQVA
jgi:hypothetical protein